MLVFYQLFHISFSALSCVLLIVSLTPIHCIHKLFFVLSVYTATCYIEEYKKSINFVQHLYIFAKKKDLDPYISCELWAHVGCKCASHPL